MVLLYMRFVVVMLWLFACSCLFGWKSFRLFVCLFAWQLVLCSGCCHRGVFVHLFCCCAVLFLTSPVRALFLHSLAPVFVRSFVCLCAISVVYSLFWLLLWFRCFVRQFV